MSCANTILLLTMRYPSNDLLVTGYKSPHLLRSGVATRIRLTPADDRTIKELPDKSGWHADRMIGKSWTTRLTVISKSSPCADCPRSCARGCCRGYRFGRRSSRCARLGFHVRSLQMPTGIVAAGVIAAKGKAHDHRNRQDLLLA